MLGTCYQIQPTFDSFEVARQTNQRFRFNVNNQVAQFDDQKLASRLAGARNPLRLIIDLNSFAGTNCAENEIFRRDELARV